MKQGIFQAGKPLWGFFPGAAGRMIFAAKPARLLFLFRCEAGRKVLKESKKWLCLSQGPFSDIL